MQPGDRLTDPEGDERPTGGGMPDGFWSGIKLTDVITACAAVVGVVVAGMQLLTYRLQARIMDGQLKAAVVSAKASNRQAGVAEATLRDLERPYVFADRIELADGSPDGTVLVLSLANYGRTPAIMRHISAQALVHGVPDIEGQPSLATSARLPSNRVIAASGKLDNIQLRLPELGSLWIPGVKRGVARLTLVLGIRYGDVFGADTREDTFRFSYDYGLGQLLQAEDIPERAARYDEEEAQNRNITREMLDPSWGKDPPQMG